jgi:hypothetical protein
MCEVKSAIARHQEFSAWRGVPFKDLYNEFFRIQFRCQHQGAGASSHYAYCAAQSGIADLLDVLIHLFEH